MEEACSLWCWRGSSCFWACVCLCTRICFRSWSMRVPELENARAGVVEVVLSVGIPG
jgi:hypothetical protein